MDYVGEIVFGNRGDRILLVQALMPIRRRFLPPLPPGALGNRMV
ncbi:MAG: hypothetical protein AB1445_13980 [Bacillota bacterium]